MTDRYFTDEELVAFLDGEEDFAPCDEIRQALVSDQPLQKRLAALTVDPELIANSFGAVKPESQDLAFLEKPQSDSGNWKRMAATGIIAIMLGSGIGYSLTTPANSLDGWKEYVAAYQALYINATLSSVNVSEAQQSAELDRVASAIGKSIKLDQLDGFPEVDYKRAQILGFEGKPLVQLAFLSQTGEPIALCIFRHDVKDSAMNIGKMENLETATWSHNGFDFLLIGGKDKRLIEQMAEHLIAAKL